MTARTLLANLLARSLTVSLCIVIAVLAAAYVTTVRAAPPWSAPVLAASH